MCRRLTTKKHRPLKILQPMLLCAGHSKGQNYFIPLLSAKGRKIRRQTDFAPAVYALDSRVFTINLRMYAASFLQIFAFVTAQLV